MDRGDWMQTYSGRQYFPAYPSHLEVDIEDIAHALSMLCRYGGHCLRFYSVAEHSVHVSRLVPSTDALHGLLHDATEAYCVDVPRPLKAHLVDYPEIENRNWLAICEHFNLDPAMPPSVKQADNDMLLTEKRELLAACEHQWVVQGSARDVAIYAFDPAGAKRLFLDRFSELMAAR